MDRHTVTVNERLLLHLWECSSNREVMDAPFALTQEGIAQALGIRVNHVSRAVKALQEQRCVTESTAHVHGESRKRKVYLITHEGLTAAQSLVRALGRRTATVKDERGATREVTLADARKLPGGPFTLTHILSAMDERGAIDLARNAPGRTSPPRSHIEEGRPKGEPFYGRPWELATIRQWFESSIPVLVVAGARGIGKSALVSKALEEIEPARHSFWYTARNGAGNEAVIRALGGFLSSVGRPDLSARLMERMSRVSEVSGILERDWPASSAVLVLDGADAVPELAGIVIEVSRKRSGKAILTSEGALPDVAALRAAGAVQLLPLGGLGSDECRRLVPKGLVGPEFEKIFRLSRGNPLSIKLLSADALEGVDARFSPEERGLLRILKVRQEAD